MESTELESGLLSSIPSICTASSSPFLAASQSLKTAVFKSSFRKEGGMYGCLLVIPGSFSRIGVPCLQTVFCYEIGTQSDRLAANTTQTASLTTTSTPDTKLTRVQSLPPIFVARTNATSVGLICTSRPSKPCKVSDIESSPLNTVHLNIGTRCVVSHLR